jgi:ATP-dependent DNA helicase RecG
MLPLPEHPVLNLGLRSLKGVGPQIESALNKKGIHTIGDLLFLMPAKYQDRRLVVPAASLLEGQEALVMGVIKASRHGRFPNHGRPYYQIEIEDATGLVRGLWFAMPAHLRHTLQKGTMVLLFGRVQDYKGVKQMVHPEIVVTAEVPPGEIRPVYPEIEDVKPGVLRRIMARARAELEGLPAIFPLSWLKDRGLSDPITALKTIHGPVTDKPGPLPEPDQTKAWKTLALYEMLFLQLCLVRSRVKAVHKDGYHFPKGIEPNQAFLNGLPFTLTNSQRQVLDEIIVDMALPRPMNRLLQGEVGSGKTVVALAAAFAAVGGGRQAAIMAPTEVLARQHYQTLLPHARRLGVPVGLLVGSMAEVDKQAMRAELQSGTIRLVVGTHALVSSGVEFQGLGLAVIDEQHRFGVAHRLALRAKADHPDILVMTATPIPRSLAMTLYGDLDLSTITEAPTGRQPVTTRIVSATEKDQAYRALADTVRAGGQAYLVAPRIALDEQNEDPENGIAAAESLFVFIRDEILVGQNIGLVHGRLKADEQQKVMAGFASGEIKALVATTVIEVGLDVANASLMIVENAERFGLAQLHQLRGRVGRGVRAASCYLITGQPEVTRLEILSKSTNGFAIAEEDLKLRGPGDSTGFRQSGLPPFSWARLPQDLPLLMQAKELAEDIIGRDPELADPHFKLVREAVNRLATTFQTQLATTG